MGLVASIGSRVWGLHAQRVVEALGFCLRARDARSFGVLLMVLRRYFQGDERMRALIPEFYRRYYGELGALGGHSNRVTYLFDCPFFEEIMGELVDLLVGTLALDERVELHCHPGVVFMGPFNEDDYQISRLVTGNREMWYEGPYERGDVKVKAGDIVIDAGANYGVFSIMAAKQGAVVYAFEPSAAAAESLQRNIRLNNCSGLVHYCASGLGEKKCELEFSEPEGSTSCARFSTLTEGYSGVKFSKTYKVQCVGLDEWVEECGVPRIDFIKADIEGAERQMLQGAQRVLRDYAPRLSLCTYHLPDDVQVLSNLILQANPRYQIVYGDKKLYACVP